MLGDRQNQRGGDHSLNIQAHQVSVGLSYADVREICLDLFRDNFEQLKGEAARIARERADEISDEFVARLFAQNPQAAGEAANPGLQTTILAAQRDYARTGDRDLKELLVSMLVDRAGKPDRTLHQIALDEAVNVAGRLTIAQMDTLTAVFVLGYVSRKDLTTVDAVAAFLSETLGEYSASLGGREADTLHLVYAGCAHLNTGITIGRPVHISGQLLQRYPEVGQAVGANAAVVREAIVNKAPTLERVFEAWDKAHLSSLSLTSVGIVLAAANFQRRHGVAIKVANLL